jgi:tRNA U38,U39,U40 pseudouridine synthase TruA
MKRIKASPWWRCFVLVWISAFVEFRDNQQVAAFQPPTSFLDRSSTNAALPPHANRLFTKPLLLSSSKNLPETKSAVALKDTIDQDLKDQCTFCSETFASRNALFRHVRSGCLLANEAGDPSSLHLTQTSRQTVAFQISYYRSTSNKKDTSEKHKPSSEATDIESNNNNSMHIKSEAEMAGNQLRDAVHHALTDFVQTELNLHNNDAVEILSSSQVSIANQRHRSLSQEVGCAAAGDAVILRFMAPSATHLLTGEETGKNNTERVRYFLKSLLEKANAYLELQNGTSQSSGLHVRLWACKWLPVDRRIHAETDCTQRVYHYLLPLRWLPEGKSLEKWWLDDDDDKKSLGILVGDNNNAGKFNSNVPFDSLSRMRNALRSAMSATIPNRRVRRKPLQQNNGVDENGGVTQHSQNTMAPFQGKSTTKRFGLLANKERRAWHNFADPNLRGDASPSNEPVWRVLDRAKIARFVRMPRTNMQTENDQEQEEEEVVAILEFRGDDFVHEQIRRIVGTALAVTHGWLPPDIFSFATQANILMPETALAPGGRLYLEGGRFHFDQLRTGKEFFSDDEVITIGGNQDVNTFIRTTPPPAVEWVQQRLLENKSTNKSVEEEDMWLEALRDIVAPRISNHLHELELGDQTNDVAIASFSNLLNPAPPPPDAYLQTLNLLRGIVASDSWPETSAARSTLIRNVVDTATSKGGNNGSFTVVNPAHHQVGNHPTLPLANKLFPDLVEAVFELEGALSRTELLPCADVDGRAINPASSNEHNQRQRRPLSSHCAVNCNAQFTPHVDSGRSVGQTISMIVGLGDYTEGHLGVESHDHDIRYKPLEFDGWKLRHYTKAYQGERFSLVWFTPL